jgi:hypothetical protein
MLQFIKRRYKTMKTLLKNIRSLFERLEERLAASALAEMGVTDSLERAVRRTPVHTFAQSVEEKLVEVAFAEVADYKDIHEAMVAEKRTIERLVKPDDCQFADNDLCFIEA